MTEYLKNNPVALRHCILYEYLQRNTYKRAFSNIRDTIGSNVFTEEELRSFFSQFRKRKMDGDDRKITDKRDVLRSDKYALRACILYEYLKYKLAENGFSTRRLWPRSFMELGEIQKNPSFSLYNNFCKKLGDDVMDYPEFDFWFRRFVNEEFDFLNYERDTDMKMLSDMPLDILRIVLQNLNIFDRMSLAGTSRSFKTFIEHQKLFYEKLEVYLSDRFVKILVGNFSVLYKNKDDNCYILFKYGNPRTEKLIKGVCCWKRALIDLKNILKHPKLHLKTFKLKMIHHQEQSEEEVNMLDKAIGALEIPIEHLQVEELFLQAISSESLLKILPSLNPGYLTTINLMKLHFTKQDDDSMKRVVEMEQFKQAKLFKMTHNSYGPLFHFYNFEKFYIKSEKLSAENVRQMKEILFKSPVLEECVIKVAEPFDIDTIRHEFEDSIQKRGDIYLYQNPITKEKIRFVLKERGLVILKRKW